ncbi:MAG: hypothetical protein AB7L41_04420 [Flavobacteriaceae bacterium]
MTEKKLATPKPFASMKCYFRDEPAAESTSGTRPDKRQQPGPRKEQAAGPQERED